LGEKEGYIPEGPQADDHSSSSHSQPELTVQSIEVEVLPGQILGEGMSSFVTYLVHTRTTLPQYKQAEFSKPRRYRDFLWLHNHLCDHFKGIIIPPLPEKSITDRFSPDFMEFRRRELEKFLKRTVSHPLLSGSSHLQTFLEAHDSEMQEAKISQQSSGFMTQMSNFFGVKVMNSLAPAIEIDMWFDGKTRYINSLEVQLISLANSISANVFKTCELSEIAQDIAATTSMLSHGEIDSDKDLSDSAQRLSEVNSQLMALHREYALSIKISFEDTLRDYIRVIGSVKTMLGYRLEKLASYQDALASLKSKKDRLEKIKREGGQVPVALNHEIERIETTMERERETFESVSKSCRTELERFEKTKSREIHQAIFSFVQASLNCQLRATDLWKSFLKNAPGLD